VVVVDCVVLEVLAVVVVVVVIDVAENVEDAVVVVTDVTDPVVVEDVVCVRVMMIISVGCSTDKTVIGLSEPAKTVSL
jgi:LytS/YehU family sensor histidine kinase